MHTIHFDSSHSDDVRRKMLYDGQLFVSSPRPASIALCDFAREMIEEAFDSIDPQKAQDEMPVEQYVSIVAPLRPKFIHHPKTKQLLRDLIEDLGCELSKTYIDVPRLRMVTSDGYLTSGVVYAHHPHYWNHPVKNGSREFNYYEWNGIGRKDAAQHIKTDTRKQPKPEEHVELDPQVRLVYKAGGIFIFSAAHLHSTVPNTSGVARYSIDFRTVNLADLKAGIAAPNIDSEPLGTSLRDFVCGDDLSPMPADVVANYDNVVHAEDSVLRFQP